MESTTIRKGRYTTKWTEVLTTMSKGKPIP
jgi:hypothetical protein